MSVILVVRGRYSDRQFVPDGPLPEAEGRAELVITPGEPVHRGSIADAFGKARVLRTGEDIAAQVRAERDDWGDR
jgi:hypothetical protein